jgi:OmpA-OmpF porin, OOP family
MVSVPRQKKGHVERIRSDDDFGRRRGMRRRAPPQPQGSGKEFMVFFDRGSSIIDAKAASMISAFVDHCRPISRYVVSLTGHTDTVESTAFNMALSLRRVEAVKQALVQQGIPAETISTTGYGEARLLVQTGDEVREWQNRFVHLYCLHRR